MANNYLKFSEEFVLSEDPLLYDKQVEWLHTVLHAADKWYEGKEPEHNVVETLFNAGIDTEGFAVDCWVDFDWKIEDGAIWFYSEEYGNIYNVGLVVQGLIKRFDLKNKVWTLTWSETCSKPRIGEFGGGAMVVSHKEIITMDVHSLANNLSSKIQLEA